MSKVKIEGIEKVNQVLARLPLEVQYDTLVKSTRQEAKHIRQRAQNNLYAIGEDRVADIVKVWKAKRKIPGVYVGAKKSQKGAPRGYFLKPATSNREGYKGMAWAAVYPMWLENGTYSGNRIKAHHWFENAVNTEIAGVERRFLGTVKKKIESAFRKAAKGKAVRATKSTIRKFM